LVEENLIFANPSLTISANALRAGAHLALEWDAVAGGGRR
jgi:hypothetical protein